MQQQNVLCVGHINLDEIITLDRPLSEEKSCVAEQIDYTLGGGATNTAKILSTQDEIDNVFLAAPIAKDDTGDKLQSLLAEYDVELVVDPYDDITSKRIRCLVSEDTEPQYIEEGGGIEKLDPNEIPADIWESTDHVHQTSYAVEQTEQFANKAQQHDISVSFNPTQGYYDADFSETCKQTDLVQMNRQEMDHFTTQNGPISDFSETHETEFIITHGPAGSTYYRQSEKYSEEAYNVTNVIDTVGAGDTFMAGALIKWFANCTPEEILDRGNLFASKAVQTSGTPDTIEL